MTTTVLLLSGDPRRQKLDATHARIAELSSQRAAIAGADLAPDELRERCAAAARNLQLDGRGQAPVRHLAKPGGLPSLVPKDDTARDLAALIAYLAGEDLIADWLFERASGDPQYSPGMPAAERAKRIAEIDSALREQLVAEEREACRLEATGGAFVMRRTITALDVDALLEAWDQAAPELLERVAGIAEYKGKGDDGSAPEWMQGGA